VEAAATDVPYIAELDAVVAVNRCRLPEVIVISGNEGHSNKREDAPQGVSVVKQTHLPRNGRRCLERHYSMGGLTACISSTPLAWKSWWTSRVRGDGKSVNNRTAVRICGLKHGSDEAVHQRKSLSWERTQPSTAQILRPHTRLRDARDRIVRAIACLVCLVHSAWKAERRQVA
jgi:hypothetical protein